MKISKYTGFLFKKDSKSLNQWYDFKDLARVAHISIFMHHHPKYYKVQQAL